MSEQASFSTLLDHYMARRGVGLEQLYKASGVAKATIEHWRLGDVRYPNTPVNVLNVAKALRLPRVSVSRLLRAGRLPTLEQLASTNREDDLRSLLGHWQAAPPTNLPSPLTSFVGRANEILDLGELLAWDDIRLLTLTGPGGSGKTRLALEVSRTVLDVLPDGVWFVPLTALRDPALVLPAVARTLGLADVAGDSPLERLQGYLRDRRLLLVTDNFEHVLGAGPELAALLTAAPQVQALVTSRAALHVGGEHEHEVLSFPAPAPDASVGALRRNAAAMLFAARARAVQPRFALTPENAGAVAEICARLDGLPLAIELAAARSKHFTPSALLERFPSRLAMSGDGPRDAEPRHQTLQATIDWSFRLLQPEEQTLFARLAVFTGGGTLDAMGAVCTSVEGKEVDAQRTFAALCAHSLVRQIEDPALGARFEMLETIREYALGRLAESGEEHALRRAHATFYVGLAESAQEYLTNTDQGDWLDRVDRDYENCLAALEWALDSGNKETAIAFAGTLWVYWNDYGLYREGSRWIDAALAVTESLPSALSLPLLIGGSVLAFGHCDHPRARSLAQTSLALAVELHDRRSIALVLMFDGMAQLVAGDPTAAVDCLRRSLDLWRALGNERGIARCLSDQASVLIMNGRFGEAEPYLREAHQLYERLHDPIGLARNVTDSGSAALLSGDIATAIPLLEQGLAMSQTPHHTINLMYCLCYLGVAYLFAGDLQRAAARLTESIRLRERTGDTQGLVYCLLGLAGVANRRQQPARAARLFGAAVAVMDAIGVVMVPAVKVLYDREASDVRAKLGDAAFDEELAAGRAMATADAVTYALGHSGG